MKNLFKKVLIFLAQNDIMWFFLKPIVSLGGALSYSRRLAKSKPVDYSYLFENTTVLNGPFQGMIYPSVNSVGSTIYPKLIGSYEQELHKTIELFCERDYSEIIDVGCAEGYYAVGLAIRIHSATVYAYDIDPTARQLCRAMAETNGVSDRVKIRDFFSPEELKNFKITRKGLIVCDCEGYEKKLFNESNLKNLTNFDLIIELHDFIDIDISEYLKSLFSTTHTLQTIKSVDDIEKARTYNFLGEALTLRDKKLLYEEKRPGTMEWLVCLAN